MSKFNFTPKSEETFKEEERERQEMFLWDAGEYPFEITSAVAKISKEKFTEAGDYISGGKAMLEFKVNIYKDDGKFQNLYDYLQAEGAFAFKLRHAAYACGLGADYEDGTLDPEDFKGKQGICKVIVQKAKDGYPAKNSINDYVVSTEAAAASTAAKTKKAKKEVAELDDEIPF